MSRAAWPARWHARVLTAPGVLTLAVLAQAHMAVGSQGIPVLAVFLQRDFGLTRAELGTFSAVAQVGACATMFLGGWLGDTFGVRRTIVLGLGLIGGALVALTTASAFAPALPILFVAGIGNGISSPAITLSILHWLPLRMRGMAMGLKQTGVPLAGIALAAGVPPLAQAFGWRMAATVVGSGVLLMGVVWGLAYRDAPKPPSSGGRAASRSAWGLLRHPGFVSLSFFATAAVAAQFAILSYLILFLYEQRGFSVVFAGLVLSAAQLGALFGRLGWGIVSDRLYRGGRKIPLLLIGSGSVVGMVALAVLPLHAPPVAFAVAVLLGLTVLAWQALHQLAVAEIAGTARAGQAVGISMAILQAGAIVGSPLFGLLVDRTGRYEVAWLVCAALVALAAAAMAVAWRERPA